MYQILIVEDERDAADRLRAAIERYGDEHAESFCVTWIMPRRSRFAARAAIACALVLTGWAAAVLSHYAPLPGGAPSDDGTFSFLSSLALLVTAIAVVTALFEAPVWTALFCATAGYTIQNIASGSSELVTMLLDRVAGVSLSVSVETVLPISDPAIGRLLVSLSVRRAGALVTIHVENYFVGERRFSPDGLPETTQCPEEGHGYGTRSMRQIVERRGGALALGTRGDVFTLDAVVPRPRRT